MGEFAKNRKGETVKIGTCEMMYYIRHDQIKTVEYDFSFDCYFRLQIESEKKVEAGYFDYPQKGILIYNAEKFFTHEQVDTLKPGIDQINNGHGILINLPCYHNLKLPDIKGLNIHFNGKSPVFELKYIFYKHSENKLYFAIECRCCGTKFICDTEEARQFTVEFERNDDLKKMVEYVEEYNTRQ